MSKARVKSVREQLTDENKPRYAVLTMTANSTTSMRVRSLHTQIKSAEAEAELHCLEFPTDTAFVVLLSKRYEAVISDMKVREW